MHELNVLSISDILAIYTQEICSVKRNDASNNIVENLNGQGRLKKDNIQIEKPMWICDRKNNFPAPINQIAHQFSFLIFFQSVKKKKKTQTCLISVFITS